MYAFWRNDNYNSFFNQEQLMKKFLLTNVRSNFPISNLTCVMNHLKFIQRVTVVVLLLLAGLSSRVSAQTCPTSNEITITVVPDLEVTADPIDVTECITGTNTMFVTVTGGTGTTTYQWQSSTTGPLGPFVDLANETSASITPKSLVEGTTHYRVVITSAGTGCDARTSKTAAAVITPQLTFTTDLKDLTECIDGTLPLTVAVAGATGNLTYKWKSSTSATGPFTLVANAPDAPSFTPPSTVQNTTYYQVEVSASGNGCNAVVSKTATVIITPQLNISVTPQDITECVGGNTPLTVTIAGATGNFTYQWYSSSDGGITFDIMNGETGVTHVPNSTKIGTTKYRVEVKADGNGCLDKTSAAATVEITPDLKVTAISAPIVECLNGTQQLIATVTGGTGTVTYQWQSSEDGITFLDIATAPNADTYTPPSIKEGLTYYQVVVKATGNGCGDVTSTSTTVDVKPELKVTAEPNDITQCINGTTPMTVAVTGATGTLTYKWKSSISATGVFTDVANGPNGPTYTPDASVDGTTYYQVEISAAGNGCDAIVSKTATMVVTKQLDITLEPQDITECIDGTNPLSVTVAGATGTLSYQWYSSKDGVTFNIMNGETGSTHIPNSTIDGVTYYQVEVSAAGNGCTSKRSKSATVTILPDMKITAISAPIVECLGGTQQLAVTLTGGTGTITYQWQSSPDGAPGSFVDITTAPNASTYTPPSNKEGTITYYQVVVKATGNGCADATSLTTTVEITPELKITADLADITECLNGTTPLQVTVTGATGNLTYKWKSSKSATGVFTDVANNSNGPTYTPDATAEGTTYYQVEISASGNGCDAIVSKTSTVVITPQLKITAAPQNIIECVDGTNQLSVTVTGATGVVSYQWYSSKDGITYAIMNGETGITTTPPSKDPGINYYQVVVKATGNGCGEITSLPATVEIIPDLSVAVPLKDITECIDGDLPLIVSVTGGTGITTYQWESSKDGITWTPISGATSATYTPDSKVVGTTQYHVIISSTGTGCQSTVSLAATVKIEPKPVAVITANTNVLCVGGGTEIQATITGGVDCTIQWQSKVAPADFIDIPGATNTTYTTPPQTVSTGYKVRFICNGNGCCDK
jgi:large repetitive protein